MILSKPLVSKPLERVRVHGIGCLLEVVEVQPNRERVVQSDLLERGAVGPGVFLPIVGVSLWGMLSLRILTAHPGIFRIQVPEPMFLRVARI